jgi:ribosomal protein S18 acetylase RimI-like enzyme
MLGLGFLRGYYRAFVMSPHAVTLVASPPDGPAGYLVGTIDHHAHHRWVLRRHGLRLMLLGAAGLMTNPRALGLFLRTRLPRYARGFLRAVRPAPSTGHTSTEAAATVGSVAVLMHVAVDPSLRGVGVGRLLTQSFVQRAHAAGCGDIRLVTRASDGVGAFYESLGWRRTEERGRDGSVVVEYRFPASESSRT